jgi:hypothetical protein
MISNTASVSSGVSDPNMANNSATATTNVGDLSRLINISTRAEVLTGNDVLIGGFFIGGDIPKTLVIRGRGPALAQSPYNVAGTMSNPFLQIISGSTPIAQNDDWQTTDPLCSTSGYTCGTPAQITAVNLDPCEPNPGHTTPPPGCAQESAIMITLPPGGYTAILSGVSGGTGVGLIEVYDPDTQTLPKLINISTRGMVLTGDSVMIGGFFIAGGTGNKTILIRGRGPSLSGAPFNISGTLSNPTLQLYSGSTVIAQNDDWQTTDPLCGSPAVSCGNAAQITATASLGAGDPCQPNPGQSVPPPGCTQESSVLITLPPGGYTAILSGVGSTTGIGLLEIFELSP